MISDRKTGREGGALRRQAQRDRETLRAEQIQRLARLTRQTEQWPSAPELRDTAQEEANGWVREGVTKLAVATKRDHVVLMAATEPSQGRVGVGSSIRCEALVAMTALGRLVAEVNLALARDGVAARVFLRMRIIESELTTQEATTCHSGKK